MNVDLEDRSTKSVVNVSVPDGTELIIKFYEVALPSIWTKRDGGEFTQLSDKEVVDLIALGLSDKFRGRYAELDTGYVWIGHTLTEDDAATN